MIKQKYILLLLNCKKYSHKREFQIKNWLQSINENIKWFHVIADKSKCDEKSHIFDYENNIIYTNTNDDYISLPHKVITAMNAITLTYDFEYIFKSVDDQILINNNFFNDLIENLEKNKYDYGGHKLTVPNHLSQYHLYNKEMPPNVYLQANTYCSGRFYFLSSRSIKNILINIVQICTHIVEDHTIALYLDDKYKNNIFHIETSDSFIDIEKYVNDKFYLYTECVNCPEICVNSIKTYLKYHKYNVTIFLTKKDREYFIENLPESKLINFNIVDDDMIKIYNESGHLGTAHIWNHVKDINTKNNKKIIHFDSDTIFRGNIIDDILLPLDNEYDLVGSCRCYKHNLNNRNDIRDKQDVVQTYCFGYNPQKCSKFDDNINLLMIRGLYNPLKFNILDFFDPVSFDIINNGGRVKFIDHNVIGGLDRKGSKLNKYKNINSFFDFGDKIVHFSSVGSGINFRKALENRVNIDVPMTYVNHALKTLDIYNYLLFNKEGKFVPEDIKKIKDQFNVVI